MKFAITLDPLSKCELGSKYIIEVCGILPVWAADESGETMKDSLMNNYPYYMGEMTGGSIDSQGIYSYPEDDDLFPLLKIERSDGDDLREVCFIYEYAIVACRDIETGDLWVTRMD